MTLTATCSWRAARAFSALVAKVSGWGVYCCDFLLLPIASFCSVRVSCPCVDTRLTRRSKLLPSPAVSRYLPMSTNRLSFLPNPIRRKRPRRRTASRMGRRRLRAATISLRAIPTRTGITPGRCRRTGCCRGGHCSERRAKIPLLGPLGPSGPLGKRRWTWPPPRTRFWPGPG